MIEPYGYAFQHEETGLKQVIDVQQVKWGFEKNNPRWKKVGPVYPETAFASKDTEIAKLREALEPFAKIARIVLSEAPADADYCSLYQDCEGVSHRVTMDECRALVKAGDK